MNPNLNSNKKTAMSTLVSYLLAAITGMIGFLNWFMLRNLVLTYMATSSIKQEAWRAVDSFTFVVFGILWLFVVIFSQYYYLKGTRHKKLMHHFCLMTSGQIFLLAACQIVPALFGMRAWHIDSILVFCVECIIGGGLIGIAKHRSRHA
ncbi:putative ferric reductase [Pullulanibacillus pueri]|uniref:hypothetical protein n=1 Tax=Pullulanibacillus pueri TaxID=1437324 RepID=UPI00166B6E39|nr:hypothetical protein [Pullulanibacillus pueri]MBM7680281.1 putative ferric reductase [Pullulanibacillus pueri]